MDNLKWKGRWNEIKGKIKQLKINDLRLTIGIWNKEKLTNSPTHQLKN